jgi:hypothetical protein
LLPPVFPPASFRTNSGTMPNPGLCRIEVGSSRRERLAAAVQLYDHSPDAAYSGVSSEALQESQ